jgi:hypothetical protein
VHYKVKDDPKLYVMERPEPLPEPEPPKVVEPVVVEEPRKCTLAQENDILELKRIVGCSSMAPC